MAQSEHLSLSQTISKVDALINSGNGDAGRLFYILEFLKNNKPLYRSDKIYLENKLQSTFSVEDELIEENELLPRIKELIDSGNGDPGRLQSIYDTLSNNKQLYNSDADYLESKLHPITEKTIITGSPKKLTFEIPQTTKEIVELKSPQTTKEIVELKSPQTTKEIVELKSPQTTKGVLPKGWSQDIVSKEKENITKDIEKEQQKIQTQEKNI